MTVAAEHDNPGAELIGFLGQGRRDVAAGAVRALGLDGDPVARQMARDA